MFSFCPISGEPGGVDGGDDDDDEDNKPFSGVERVGDEDGHPECGRTT